MKKILFQLSFVTLFAVLFFSCKKDEGKALYNKPAQLTGFTASTDNIVLSASNDSVTVVTFNWQKPDYGISIIPSYTLQFDVVSDTAGTNPWGNAINVPIQNGGLQKGYLGTNLNALLATQLSLPTGTESTVAVRIVSDIKQTTGAASTIPSAYAVLLLKVTPYKALIVYPALLVKGGNSWQTPAVRTDGYLLTSANFNSRYEGYLNLPNADGYGGDALQLIATTDGTVYGWGGTSTTIAAGSTGNLWLTPAPGYFKINADVAAGTVAYTAVKFFISGDDNGWSTSATPMTFDAATSSWIATNVALTAGKTIVFTSNGSYDISYKVTKDAGKLIFAGAPNWPSDNIENIAITKTGVFTVMLNMSQGDGNYTYSIK